MRKYFTIAFKFGFYLLCRLPKMIWYYLFAKKISYEKRYDFIRHLSYKLNQRLNIECHIEGKENVPATNNVVFLPNHQSMFDTLLVLAQFDHRVLFIAKKEVSRMPIISLGVKIVDALLLDREDARSALKTLKMAANELAKDRNMIVFLEGTRTKNPDRELGEFKNGGVRPAYVTKATIVPVVIDRAWEIFDKNIHKKKYIVDLIYLPALQYSDYKDYSYQELSQKIHDMISLKLKEIRLVNKELIK